MRPEPRRMQEDHLSGSSASGEPEFLVVGKLGRPHGIHGEIVMVVYTEFPERIQPGIVVYIGSEYQPLQITKRRPHGRGLLLTFEGYHTRETAADLRNLMVQVPAVDRPPLPDGEYYHHQLLGLQVIDEQNTSLGWITAILATGANDVYVVKDSEGSELLIPAIDSVVLGIDLEAKQVTVHLLPGLLPGS